MRSPEFWRHDRVLARLLAPLGWCYAAATARRVARPGWRAPVPVLCIGNPGAGGSGKTTVALDLGARLAARGRRVAFLTRGHGGRQRGPLHVDPARHTAAEVGDEALLLAALAPAYLGADRAATARLAIAEGAQVLVLDDGLQNPTLEKTLSLLVIDGAVGFGNARVHPAGPLREPIAAAAARCGAAILIGADATGALAHLPPILPVLRAHLVSDPPPPGALIAIAGIGRPEKFRETLEAAGGDVRRLHDFPDHHAYTEAELRPILAAAGDATVVTTPKDMIRVPPALRAAIVAVGVRLAWDDPPDILLERLA
ncbi:MAG: tetraacyldisaccharide 4'-kinase [Acetobacteraceae bacterium]|nr:tetraacyldisaccharide 4'-kinase [Acetobacteraceae bacterium]